LVFLFQDPAELPILVRFYTLLISSNSGSFHLAFVLSVAAYSLAGFFLNPPKHWHYVNKHQLFPILQLAISFTIFVPKTMKPKSILLVEDDQNLRQSMLLLINHAGYFVTATDCLSDVMGIMQSGRYKLVIIDLNMPQARSVLLPKIRETHPFISIVLLADHSPTTSDGAVSSAHYLIKPVAPEFLLDCIDTLMHDLNPPGLVH
jgi:CheY-like chemotaxis protein